MLPYSVVVVAAVVRTRPRAIPLTMITMRKSTHGFPFVSHIWVAYGAPLGGSSGRRSSAIITYSLTQQETGNDCDVNSGLQASRKTDFYDVFLFSHKQRTIVPFPSKLISSQ